MSERIEIVRVPADCMIKVEVLFSLIFHNQIGYNLNLELFRMLFVLIQKPNSHFACAILHFMNMTNLKRYVLLGINILKVFG